MRNSYSKFAEDTGAEWLIRRLSGLTEQEDAEFAAWLSADPQNRRAFTKLERAWRALNHPREAGQGDVVLEGLARRGQRRLRRSAWTAAGGLAAAMALVLVHFSVKVAQVPQTAPPTAIVHPDARHLPDGSVVDLNAGAQFAWKFTAAERDLQLTNGEALFSVAKDAKHPFVVTAGGVKVRAVGTAFNVRLVPGAVDVLVTEGKVRVDLPAGPVGETSIAIEAGEHATIALDKADVQPQVTRATSDEVQRTLAWHSKRIEFTHAPLAEVADIFNRENPLKLVIEDESIRDLQITGIYWTDDPEGFIRLLNTGLDLRADRRGMTVVLRGP